MTLVTGATGLLGRALLPELGEVVIVSRRPEAASLGVEACSWEAIADRPARAVVHLAGERVAGRWTAARKRRIRASRVLGTRRLVEAMTAWERPPEVLVSASAVGFYGDRGEDLLDEGTDPGEGFLAEVCRAWEEEALAATALGVRVVCLRIGMVLSSEGGALAQMLPPFRLGRGARRGAGEQWMPWIHVADLVRLFRFALDEAIAGPVNAVAPEPVTNAAFTTALAGALGRPAVLAVPSLALRLGLGELAGMLLASQRVVPAVALDAGFRFRHPELAGALEDLLR